MLINSAIMLKLSMSIALTLFSDRQAKLFTWLFGQPSRSYHLNELIRLTGLGSASAQAELGKLTDAGLVQSERIGNMRRFRANPNSPVFAELTQLTRKLLGVDARLREMLATLQPAIHAAWLFGSVAKREDHAESDIDVMVVGNDLSMTALLACLLPLENELGRKINPTLYSVSEFNMRKSDPSSFVNKVMNGPIISLISAAPDHD
jgi:predicted nucleotidyltransferase